MKYQIEIYTIMYIYTKMYILLVY